MNQVFLASTFFGAMNLAAALDAGHFGDRRDHRRTLLVSTNSLVPEATTPLDAVPGAAPLLNRFDHVVDWNRAVGPFHPSTFTAIGEPVVTSRWVRAYLGLADGPLELVIESVQVPPAGTLAALFSDAEITVYADGLMSYGPTRVRLRDEVGGRIGRLLHLDLVPGLEPMLLSELDVPAVAIDDDAFRAVIGEVAAAAVAAGDGLGLPDRGRRALVLGQYIAALGLMTEREEGDLYAHMVRELAAAGYDHVVLRPHPTAPPSTGASMAAAAADAGAQLTVLGAGATGAVVERIVPLEVVLTRWRPDVVAGCFSTGLLLARRFFDLDVVASGTGEMLTALAPFGNSNRIPLVIVDATTPRLDASRPGGVGDPILARGVDDPDLPALVRSVAFAMQPRIHAASRNDVEAALNRLDPVLVERYLPGRRRAALGLPGVAPTVRRRTKVALREAYRRGAGFGRRHPVIVRPYRGARRLMTPAAERLVRASPRARRLLRSITEDGGPAASR